MINRKKNKHPKFAAIMRARMSQQGLSVGIMAKALGASRNSVREWTLGYHLPGPHYIGGIADLLDTPVLAQIALERRGGNCAECMAPFLSNLHTGVPQRFCSRSCQRTWNGRAAREKNARRRKRVLEETTNALEAAMAAKAAAESDRADAMRLVAEFCNDCEWDGLCKMPECKLRALSPLPLAKEAVA